MNWSFLRDFRLRRLVGSVLLWLLIAPGLVGAEEKRPVEPSPLFSDGVVLQRDKPITLWGTSAAGATVNVKFRAQAASATADESGSWAATLRPEKAGGPDVLTFETAGGKVEVSDVMVGEVWLAAGQSNMFFKIKSIKPPFAQEPAAANPAVRFFPVGQRAEDQPVHSIRGRWHIANEQNAPEMSAVAFFFANEIQKKLDVPVGIVISAVGGTSIAAWSSAEGLGTEPATSAPLLEEWQSTMAAYPEAMKAFETSLAGWNSRRTEAEAAGQKFDENKPKPPLGPDSPKRPMALFNGMINPLIPFSLRGVLWYQGESDATRIRAPRYAKLLQALIRDWRARWAEPGLPFLLVQLPAVGQDEDWVVVQRAQAEAATQTGSRLITTLDLGDKENVHPQNKKPVGVRLANLALSDVYALKLPSHAPRVESAARRATGEVVLKLACDDGASLVFSPAGAPQGFEVAGADGVYFPATVKTAGNEILASSREVASPVKIRYAGTAWPALGVFDSTGLPMGPCEVTLP